MSKKISTIFELLDQVDNKGIVSIKFSNEQLDWFDKSNEVNNLPRFKTKTETAKFIMDNIFGEWGIFNLPLQVKKTILTKIDLSTAQDEKSFIVYFDFFKYLNINKNNPLEQIAEIKKFLKLSKELMTQIKVKEKKFEFGGTVRILNNRVKGKTTYEILLQAWDNQDFPELNQKLVDMAEESPTLKDLLNQTALGLNKIGPYAWATIKLKELGVWNL